MALKTIEQAREQAETFGKQKGHDVILIVKLPIGWYNYLTMNSPERALEILQSGNNPRLPETSEAYMFFKNAVLVERATIQYSRRKAVVVWEEIIPNEE